MLGCLYTYIGYEMGVGVIVLVIPCGGVGCLYIWGTGCSCYLWGCGMLVFYGVGVILLLLLMI